MQSYQLGRQICQVSLQCKQMRLCICLYCRLWPETCPPTGKSQARRKMGIIKTKSGAAGSSANANELQEKVPPLGTVSCHSLRRWQMPDPFASGAGCLVHYLYRSADLNFGV